MIIKILGSGCKKCVKLGENAKAAADAAGKQADRPCSRAPAHSDDSVDDA